MQGISPIVYRGDHRVFLSSLPLDYCTNNVLRIVELHLSGIKDKYLDAEDIKSLCRFCKFVVRYLTSLQDHYAVHILERLIIILSSVDDKKYDEEINICLRNIIACHENDLIPLTSTSMVSMYKRFQDVLELVVIGAIKDVSSVFDTPESVSTKQIVRKIPLVNYILECDAKDAQPVYWNVMNMLVTIFIQNESALFVKITETINDLLRENHSIALYFPEKLRHFATLLSMQPDGLDEYSRAENVNVLCELMSQSLKENYCTSLELIFCWLSHPAWYYCLLLQVSSSSSDISAISRLVDVFFSDPLEKTLMTRKIVHLRNWLRSESTMCGDVSDYLDTSVDVMLHQLVLVHVIEQRQYRRKILETVGGDHRLNHVISILDSCDEIMSIKTKTDVLFKLNNCQRK